MTKETQIHDAQAERARALLDFWFGPPGAPEAPREVWFKTTPEFDAALRDRFLDDQRSAAAGEYDSWLDAPDTALALVLLLDQVPRNVRRGTAAAYASDGKAREAARTALARGHDGALPPVRRLFLYLPFQHSEDLADQELSVRLFASLPPGGDDDETDRYAERHREIIARFGRFPHRNAILGRVSTPEEEAFLKEPDSSF